MKLETFFAKFDQFADAPDAVAKMRELVLQLAVQGKLVPFDADGEEQTVGDHIEFQNGYAFKSEWFKPSGMRLCRNLNVSHGNLDWRESAFVDDKVAKEFERFALGEGDIVLSLDRPLIATGLKVARVTQADLPCLLLQRVAKPVPKHDQLDLSYFMLWLNSSEFVDSIDPGRSNGVPHISTRQVQRLPFALPPLAEQKRIVAKVDELMALCDRLEAQQQERETRHALLARASLARFADAPTPANLPFLFHPSYAIPPADLRKSILTLAVQGKLVPQDPNDEPAEVPAVSRVTKSKGEREAPFELPGNWKWMQLGQVSELINGDRSKNYPNKAEYVPEGVAWINTGHIEPDGTLSTEWMHFITRKKFDSLRSGKVRSGDLVYCLRGATLGKTAIITQYEEGAVASSLVIIRLIPAVEPRFAYRFLTSPLGREQIFQFDNGSAQPNLSANSVKKYWVPIPPLAEQRRIVAKVEQLMALVDALETQLAASRATAANLLSALVAELTTA